VDILFAASEAHPLVKTGGLADMREDFSWTRSATAYIDLYALLLEQQHPARETGIMARPLPG